MNYINKYNIISNFDKLFESLYMETDDTNVLYHVTRSKNVPSIVRQGLLPMQTSNWVVAKDKQRYGKGEIYAFEKFSDAIKWALKMSWDFYGDMTSSKICILTIRNTSEWDEDPGSIIDKAGHIGKWYKQMKMVPAVDIIKVTVLSSALLGQLKGGKYE